jgi:predicted metal-binding protein
VKIRKITPQLDTSQLEVDLKSLHARALSEGAVTASIIDAGKILFNQAIRERIETSSDYPSLHWPVDYPKDYIQEALEAFHRGILIRVATPPNMHEYRGGPITDPAHRRAYYKVYEMVTDLESASFYRGYHLAMGFATGNCRSVFCHEEPHCDALIKGHACLHPFKGRPSMEALGIDAYAMARKLKWELPRKKSFPLLVGLVMVA